MAVFWNFEFGLIDPNPGFSFIAVNPHRADGEVLVELHGFTNEAIGSRMHFIISRHDSAQWFSGSASLSQYPKGDVGKFAPTSSMRVARQELIADSGDLLAAVKS